MDKKLTKEYEIYSTLDGLDINGKKYTGNFYRVLAKSVKQAYFLIYNHIWKDENSNIGIIKFYSREQ